MKALRKLWLNVHLWLGLILLIPVAILGVTGTVLTFDDDLDRVLTPARYAVSDGPSLPASALVERARTELGDSFAVASVSFPKAANDPFIVQARAKGRPVEGRPPQSRRVWLDPASGRVLDIANPRGGLFGAMHQLHGSLMIPEIGRKVVGWMGWSLLISSLTGIWLWWPRGAFLRAFRWGQRPLFSFNFHHFVGFWVLIPLAILAATGIYISFPQSARTFTQVVTMAPASPEKSGRRGGGEGGAARGAAPLEHTTLSIDDVEHIARAAAPNGELIALTLPSRPRGDDAPRWRADVREDGRTLQFNISDETGAEARPSRGGNQDPAALLMRRLHDGRDQPLWWRIVIAITGLAPLLLGITGLLGWLWRNRAKARGEEI
jgi:uncharacterized iron-regulated membrane protein